jgi:hypothetical protein
VELWSAALYGAGEWGVGELGWQTMAAARSRGTRKTQLYRGRAREPVRDTHARRQWRWRWRRAWPGHRSSSLAAALGRAPSGLAAGPSGQGWRRWVGAFGLGPERKEKGCYFRNTF